MKLGAVVLVFVAFLIWSYTGRFYDIFLGIAILMLVFWLISLIGRIIRSDRTVSIWQRRVKFLAKIEVIAFVARLTWIFLD